MLTAPTTPAAISSEMDNFTLSCFQDGSRLRARDIPEFTRLPYVRAALPSKPVIFAARHMSHFAFLPEFPDKTCCFVAA